MFDITPKKKGWSFKSIAGSIAIAGVAAAPFISSFKSDTNVAYKNDANQPSICFGHTKNVKMTDRASDDQCKKFLEEDLTDAVSFVIQQTPSIVERTDTLKAATHHVFGMGKQSYIQSPMLVQFKAGNWEAGCKAFVGYNIHYHYKFKRLGQECTRQADGTWLCKEPALVAIRKNEMQLCLNQKKNRRST